LKTSRDQLHANRTIAANDEARLLLLDDLTGLRANCWAYSSHEAILAEGIMAADAVQPNDENLSIVKAYYNQVVAPAGQLLKPCDRLDETVHGLNLLRLAARTKEDRYRLGAEKMVSFLIAKSNREGGTLAYIGDLRLVDTLGMTCPFLAEYGSRFDNPPAMKLAVRQVCDFVTYGIEPKSGLPYHGYNPDDSFHPIGVVGWGRGTGWYGLGLVGTLAWLDKADGNRTVMQDALRGLAGALRHYQRPDGGWGALMNVNGSPAYDHYDSSATAMLAFVLQKGMQMNILPGSYQKEVSAALASLKHHTHADGTVDYVQGETMSLVRFSSSFEPSSYGQGMALALAAAELSRQAR
jgi:unsaturated rhamnogalacturonyl hydrolase